MVECCPKLSRKKRFEHRAYLTWTPVLTDEFGCILVLNSSGCGANSLKTSSYVKQSHGYMFRPGFGAVGRCFATKQHVHLKIDRRTRFDEFHHVALARQNEVKTCSLFYDSDTNTVKEFVNTVAAYTKTDMQALRSFELQDMLKSIADVR